MHLRRLTAAGLAAVLLASGCSNDADTNADGGDTTSSASPSDAPADDALAAYEAAVGRTADATSLAFDANVQIATDNGVVEVQLSGTRDGQDRTLEVRTDQGTLTYVVADGQATVDAGDGPQPVDLAAVPAAPSLAVLADLPDAVLVEPGVVTGTIDAAEVLHSDEAAAAGTVTVTVHFDPDGYVTALELRADDGTYAAAVAYHDVNG